jgi:hypothetical protein
MKRDFFFIFLLVCLIGFLAGLMQPTLHTWPSFVLAVGGGGLFLYAVDKAVDQKIDIRIHRTAIADQELGRIDERTDALPDRFHKVNRRMAGPRCYRCGAYIPPSSDGPHFCAGDAPFNT